MKYNRSEIFNCCRMDLIAFAFFNNPTTDKNSTEGKHYEISFQFKRLYLFISIRLTKQYFFFLYSIEFTVAKRIETPSVDKSALFKECYTEFARKNRLNHGFENKIGK